MKLLSLFISLLVLPITVTAIEVNNFYGIYDATSKEIGQVSSSLKGPISEFWISPPKPKNTYKIAVLVPHLKDGYWKSVWHGVEKASEKLGTNLTIFDAGGYENFAQQRLSLSSDVLDSDFDGVLIGSIKYTGFDKYVNKLQKKGIPVVALVNDMLAPELDGKVVNPYRSYGEEVGLELIRKSGGKDIRVALFPGPKGVVWSEEMVKGLRKIIKMNPESLPLGKVTIIANLYGEAQPLPQSRLINFVLKNKEKIDYIIANPIAAEQAVRIYEKYKHEHPGLKIFSFFLTPEIYYKVASGAISYAPTDFAVTKGEISLELLVKVIESKAGAYDRSKLPFLVQTKLVGMRPGSVEELPYDGLWAPEQKAIEEQKN